MRKIKEIFSSWFVSAKPSEQQSIIASKRMEVCNSCEHKRTIPYTNCGLCGCPLKAKIFSPLQNACPAGKWDC